MVLHARIWTERGARPATRDILTVARHNKDCYRIGDRFTLNVQTECDGYLTLLDIGTSGNVCQLLADYPLAAGAPVALSGPDQSREWVIGGPPGVERLRAFVTLQPVSLFPGVGSPGALSPQGRMSEIVADIEKAGSVLKRLPPGSWTDATCEFVVLGG
jgi:hypothetical protein